MRLFTLTVLVCGAMSTNVVFAGGPMRFVKKGPAIRWDTIAAIKYKVTAGSFGPFTEAEVQALVKKAFQTWTDIGSATLKVTPDGTIPAVTTTVAYLALENDPKAGNVVVLDPKGEIMTGVVGKQAQNILGWASPVVDAGRISRFYSLMNGMFATSSSLQSTMTHEFGHALGLDHTQINAVLAVSGSVSDAQYVPTMFPTTTADPLQQESIKPDDAAWFSWLYPSTDFAKSYGLISGQVMRKGKPVSGANVIAIAIVEENGKPSFESLRERYSCVTDYLLTIDGRFDIPVRPGRYRLRVEPIRRAFVAGSSVGPFADGPRSVSFMNPVTETAFVTEYVSKAGGTINVGPLVVP